MSTRRDQLRELAAQIGTREEPSAAARKPDAAFGVAVANGSGAAARSAEPPQHRRPPIAGSTTKVTLNVPLWVVDALRLQASRTQRTQGDVLLTALIEHGEALAERCGGDTERIRLGLPPLNFPSVGERKQRRSFTVRLSRLGLAEFDKTAASLSVNRSDLAAALVSKARNDW